MEPQTLYKLMILYMLKKVNFPLSNAQLWSFFEENGYTNFITFEQTVDALHTANLLSAEKGRQATLYTLLQEGEEALYYFSDQIPEAVRADMDEFLQKNRYQFRNETGVTANWYKSADGDYTVEMKIREDKRVTFEIRLSVPTEDQAEEMCMHLNDNAQNIYGYILRQIV